MPEIGTSNILPLRNVQTDQNGEFLLSHNRFANYESYIAAVARGEIVGANQFYGFGKLTTTGAVTKNIISPVPGITRPPYTGVTGIQMKISSSSTEDGAGTQTGINSVEIHYINNTGDEVHTTVTLNGTNFVNLSVSDVRFVQCMHFITIGTLGVAAGNISLVDSSTGLVIYSYIVTGDNRCTSSLRYVPNGKRLIIEDMYGSSTSTTSDTTIGISFAMTRIEGHDSLTQNVLISHMQIGTQNGASTLVLGIPFVIPANTIIGFVCTGSKAATITAGFNGYIENI